MFTNLRENVNGATALLKIVLALPLLALMLPTDALSQQIKSPGTWTPVCNSGGDALACLPEAREGAAAAQVANQIIVSHGFSGGDTNDTRIYDIDTDTWSDPLPVPAPAAYRSELAGASHGNKLYAVGGRNGGCISVTGLVCSDLEVYDPVANAWSALAPMPTARAGLAAVVVGDTLVALGGRTGSSPNSGTALDCVEAYNIAADTWSPACGTLGALAPMPVPTGDTFAVAHGGEIFVIGGYDGGARDDVQIYDVTQDVWFQGMTMPSPRANLALGKCGKVILALGGQAGSNLDTVEAYDIPSDTWITLLLNPMPTVKSEHGAVSHGGQVFAIGSGIFGASTPEFEALKCSSLFRR